MVNPDMRRSAEVLRALFPDLEVLHAGGYLATCPLHPQLEPLPRGYQRIVFFDSDGWLQGCSSGACSRGDVFSAAVLRRAEAA